MDWSHGHTPLLQQLTTYQRVGLIADLDGTLAPIVMDPALARITERNHALLLELQKVLALVAIVSGRRAVDIHQRVGIDSLEYIGNHGLEVWENGRVQITPQVATYLPALAAVRDAVPLTDEMMIEDKGVTLSIHYRRATNPAQIEREMAPVIQSLAAQHQLNFFQGRMVFEVRPPLNFNKGTALNYLVSKYQPEALVFIGDDTTDVDAMRAARELRAQNICFAVAVGVISDEAPPAVRDEADLWVHGITEVEAFLEWMLQAFSAS